MQPSTIEEVVDLILARDARYHRDAYLFVRDALDHTRKMLEREQKAEKTHKRVSNEEKHVSGQELLAGVRELALETFGPMTMTVFAEWGIHSCRDFGELVFVMVENLLLKKTDKDTRADFENGYDFYEAFQKPFLPRLKRATSISEAKVTEA